MNAKGIQGPLNQRSDFKRAKQTCKILYQEHTAIIVVETYPPEQHVRQRRDQQFEGLAYRLGASAGTAISSFLHKAFVFIFVITVATKQGLVVNVELGFVEIFILE